MFYQIPIIRRKSTFSGNFRNVPANNFLLPRPYSKESRSYKKYLTSNSAGVKISWTVKIRGSLVLLLFQIHSRIVDRNMINRWRASLVTLLPIDIPRHRRDTISRVAVLRSTRWPSNAGIVIIIIVVVVVINERSTVQQLEISRRNRWQLVPEGRKFVETDYTRQIMIRVIQLIR